MQQEVVQAFLNLPGIVGLALMDGRSRPYFCGVDRSLNFQQKEALAQGILQVIETIPEGFDAFEFQFSGHCVYIYKLQNGIVLLVLTHSDMIAAEYLRIIKDLKATLEEDIANAIATFRSIAGNLTLSGTPYQTTVSSVGETVAASEFTATLPPSVPALDHEAALPGLEMATAGLPTLKEVQAALNQLSQFTTEYLGNHVITNYWKSTRPTPDLLPSLQIGRDAQFSLDVALTPDPQQRLSLEAQRWVQTWVAAFVNRCAIVMRDFPTLAQQKALTAEQRTLLFPA